jgi:hypothetical protein
MINDIWNSDVNRWHASRCHALRNSGDTTDAHAARCCRLLLALKPDASANLIAATPAPTLTTTATNNTTKL